MTLEASARITNPTGLHARPAVKLAQLAAGFDAAVQLRVGDDGAWVKARSTAKVMKLKARANTTLFFRAEGEQAQAALNALIAFVKRDFDEGPAATDTTADTTAPSPALAEASATGFYAEPASEGLVIGVIHRLEHSATPGTRHQGDPTEERAALDGAIARAAADLAALAGRSEALAAEIIMFQNELLKDGDFLAPAFAAIAAGAAAEQAWTALLDAEINDYANTTDEYFRGRASDLRDLHERVLARLQGAETTAILPERAIVLTDELTPSRFLELDRRHLVGVAMFAGSRNSHVAMLARARGVPLLIKLQTPDARITDGVEAVLDAETGRLLLQPDTATRARYEARIATRTARAREQQQYLAKPAHTAAGVVIKVYLNVDDPALLDGVDPAHCDGIGLTRTEFLFYGQNELPDEDRQYQVYRRLLEWADGRPVTIRTLDAGGDKPIAGLTPDDENNPFLGVRGLRLSLARPEVFRVQLRALARAAAHGPLKVMVPMVTLPGELDAARQLLEQEVAALQQTGMTATAPPLGMMVEVPAAALGIAAFRADFLSIGSNDLVQYVMAAGRDCAGVADLQDPLHPAVLELIGRVADQGARAGIEVSVCGEMAAQPRCLAALIEAGVRVLSVPPAVLAKVKAALAQCA